MTSATKTRSRRRQLTAIAASLAMASGAVRRAQTLVVAMLAMTLLVFAGDTSRASAASSTFCSTTVSPGGPYCPNFFYAEGTRHTYVNMRVSYSHTIQPNCGFVVRGWAHVAYPSSNNGNAKYQTAAACYADSRDYTKPNPNWGNTEYLREYAWHDNSGVNRYLVGIGDY